MSRILLLLALCAGMTAWQPRFTTPPRLVHQVRPVYPPLARQARIQGTVKFAVRVDEDGAVDEIRLISGHPFLVAAAMDAVRQYRYVPAYLGGRPVEAVIAVAVTFTLGAERPPQQPGGKETVIYAVQ